MTDNGTPIVRVGSIISLPRSYFDYIGTLAGAVEWLHSPRRYGDKLMTPAERHGWSQVYYYEGDMPGWHIIAIV